MTAGWQRLRELTAALPKDDGLDGTIARGVSYVVAAKSEKRSIVTAGPFGTVADAQQAVRAMGSPPNATITQVAPYVIRLGPYTDRPAADALSALLTKQGMTSVVTEEPSYSFARSGPAPDIELWREASRTIDGFGGARRFVLSPDGKWMAVGTDDGTVAILNATGGLVALPKFNAGISALLFSADSGWLFVGSR